MSDISVRTHWTIGGDDSSWLGKTDALEDADGITLLRSAFDLVSLWPNGFIPSGICIAKIISSGLYGPYAGRSNEVQQIAVDATGGTFTITFDGATTAAISATATAAAVQAALEALSTVNPGDIVVTGGPGAAGGATPYVLTFGGRYYGQNVPQVTTAAGSLTGGAGTATPSTTTQGGSAITSGLQIPVGFLAWAVPYDRYSTGNIGASLLWHGEVIVSKLPANNGLDAAAQIDLNKFRFV